MTMQTEELAGQERQPEDQAAVVSSTTDAESARREKELQDRLAAQGRTLAEVRRANEALQTQLAETSSAVAELRESMTAQQRAQDARDQAATEAWLDSLPEDQRTREELRMQRERVQRLEETLARGRNDEAKPQPSGSRPQPSQQQETPQQYQARRMREIIDSAQTRYGVTITRDELEAIPEEEWEQESAFTGAVFGLAASKAAKPATTQSTNAGQGDDDMANKDKSNATTTTGKETEADIEARVRRNVLRELGVSGAEAPRAAASRRNGPAPTSEEVKEATFDYNSRQGPKAQVARLKDMRSKM